METCVQHSQLFTSYFDLLKDHYNMLLKKKLKNQQICQHLKNIFDVITDFLSSIVNL